MKQVISKVLITLIKLALGILVAGIMLVFIGLLLAIIGKPQFIQMLHSQPKLIMQTLDCRARGGHTIRGANNYFCMIEYSDGGKQCSNSEECQGNCVTNIPNNLGKEGVCQKSNSTDGCWAKVESSTINCLMYGDILFPCDSDGNTPCKPKNF